MSYIANGSGGGGGTVTNVTASAPIVSSGGATPDISAPTVVTSAAALTANALVKGAGLQASAASAVASDDGTTLTYTGTGGVLATAGALTSGATGVGGSVKIFGASSGSNNLTAPGNGTQLTTDALTFNMSGASANVLATNALTVSSTNGIITLSPIIAAAGAASVVVEKTANSATFGFGQISEQITLNTGATTTDSAANLLPANAIIEGVVARITTTITTAANWSLGDATTAARFMAANSTLTSGTTAVGLQHMQGSVATDAAGPVQTAAAKLRITTNANPGAGVIRITVFYRTFVAPTN